MTNTAATRARPTWPFAVMAVVPLVAAVVLWTMGRVLWCKQGDLLPYSFDIWSAHNSQHLLDPYTFTHVLHGVVFYGILRAIFGPERFRIRLMVAVVIESIWEVVENSSWIIDKYREATISLDYNGDSVANSMADIVACVGGFMLAATLPAWGSVAFFLIVEVVLALWIRDSLILNIVMLTVPLDVIKEWQMGNSP